MFKVKMLALNDFITNFIAGLAILSPSWLPTLSTISQEASLLLPILGVVWLAVQIYAKLKYGKEGD